MPGRQQKSGLVVATGRTRNNDFAINVDEVISSEIIGMAETPYKLYRQKVNCPPLLITKTVDNIHANKYFGSNLCGTLFLIHVTPD